MVLNEKTSLWAFSSCPFACNLVARAVLGTTIVVVVAVTVSTCNSFVVKYCHCAAPYCTVFVSYSIGFSRLYFQTFQRCVPLRRLSDVSVESQVGRLRAIYSRTI